MPVVSCPGCREHVKLPISARGHSFKCPKCGTPFSVGKTPGSPVAATVPASVIPAPDDDEDPTPSRSGLWIGVGLLAFGILAVGGAGAAYLLVPMTSPNVSAVLPLIDPDTDLATVRQVIAIVREQQANDFATLPSFAGKVVASFKEADVQGWALFVDRKDRRPQLVVAQNLEPFRAKLAKLRPGDRVVLTGNSGGMSFMFPGADFHLEAID